MYAIRSYYEHLGNTDPECLLKGDRIHVIYMTFLFLVKILDDQEYNAADDKHRADNRHAKKLFHLMAEEKSHRPDR